MADKDKSDQLECPKCLKKKMVFKGRRFLTNQAEEEPLGIVSPIRQGPEPLKMYTCKKCGYCELYTEN